MDNKTFVEKIMRLNALIREAEDEAEDLVRELDSVFPDDSDFGGRLMRIRALVEEANGYTLDWEDYESLM